MTVGNDPSGPVPAYSVAPSGRSDGEDALDRLPWRVSHYLAKATCCVLAQPFWKLITRMHRASPEMVADTGRMRRAMPDPNPPMSRAVHLVLAGMANAVSFPGRGGRGGVLNGPGDATLSARDWRVVGDDLMAAMERWPRGR